MIETVGNLRIINELGHGGMGVVYLAEHILLDKKFAVKSLNVKYTDDPNFRQRFYQEAKNQALLSHPNIVQATDFYEEQGQYFLVMEYVEGEELSKFIRQEGRLSEKEALTILKGILEGLGFAHRKGMVHRDIKPSNIIVSTVANDLSVRIMDFGLAILAGGDRLTSAESGIIGTPWYQSPEQIKTPQEIDHRSDIYSLGILLFEMLTGKVPFEGEVYSVINKQISEPTPDITKICPDISKDLAKIVYKCMAKNPDERFQGCDELLKHLAAYEKAKAKDQIPKRKRWPVLVTAAALACLAVFVVFSQISQNTRSNDANNGSEIAYHKTVAALIENSVLQRTKLRRLIRQLPYVESNLQLAQSQKDPKLIDKWSKTVKDYELGINSGISKFNEITKELKGYPQEMVTVEIEKYLLNETDQGNKVLTRKFLELYAEDRTEIDLAEFSTIFCSN